MAELSTANEPTTLEETDMLPMRKASGTGLLKLTITKLRALFGLPLLASGVAGQALILNGAGDALEFGDVAAGGGGGGGAPYSGALVSLAATFDPGTNTIVAIPFDNEDEDIGDWYDGAQPTRFTVPAGVTRVRLKGAARTAGSSAGQLLGYFAKNGSSAIIEAGLGGSDTNSDGTDIVNITSAPIAVSPGDYFEFYVNVISADDIQNAWFSIEAVESATPIPGRFVGAVAHENGTSRSISTGGAATVLPLEDVDFDTHGFFDLGTPDRLTIPAGVTKVKLFGRTAGGSVTSGDFQPRFRKNGADIVNHAQEDQYFGISQIVSEVLEVVEGDYFQLAARASSGATISTSILSIEAVDGPALFSSGFGPKTYPYDLPIFNAGAEEGTPSGWTVSTGDLQTLTTAGGGPPNTGSYLFYAGNTALSRAHQDIEIPEQYHVDIDAGLLTIDFSFFVRAVGLDRGRLNIRFLNVAGNEMSVSAPSYQSPTAWTQYNESAVIPALTRFIRIEIDMDREEGTSSDAYMDDFAASIRLT